MHGGCRLHQTSIFKAITSTYYAVTYTLYHYIVDSSDPI